MSKKLKNNTAPQTAAVAPGGAIATDDVDAIMKKYDRESNVRIWEGKPKMVVHVIMIAFSLYTIWSTLFSTAAAQTRLATFLGMILIIGYLVYPAKKGDTRVNHLPWYDVLIMACGGFGFFYFAVNANELAKKARKLSKETFFLVIAIMSILAVVELCRRCVGLPIIIVVAAFLIYTFTNVRFGKVVSDLFYTTSGIIGSPISACEKFIVVFIIFGAFLERSGISNFFIDLANSLVGSASGGPAKVAVISSALCGMVSGSSVGNTVTTGSVTIPMMKKTGYKGEFAGAVEAAASTGGQIMPPIMGTAAFLMLDYIEGSTYGDIALRALLPAILYFAGIFIAVHLEAKKLGLEGIPKDQLPVFKVLIRKIYLLLPLVVLVGLVSTNTYSLKICASIAIVVTIVVGAFNKDNRISFSKCMDALDAGARGTISVAVACAMAGIVAGCITATGLASKLINGIIAVADGKIFIALFLTMLCCIVLGMGVPTTATYIIMASTCAPILTRPEIGVPVLAAHFFVFYFGIVADITPPVALAAYAGSAIAKAPPMMTAFNATRLAIAGFIVPYICAMNPAMLLINAAPLEIVQIVITSLIGIFGVQAGLSGYVYAKMNPLFRILIVAGGLTLMTPGLVTDLIGIVLVAGIVVYQRTKAKKVAA
ncbi:MAG: TRAP transporter permease [Eubacteriales bacterium]|nr:TRAP transporter permease [Eubacteriales bacterium]